MYIYELDLKNTTFLSSGNPSRAIVRCEITVDVNINMFIGKTDVAIFVKRDNTRRRLAELVKIVIINIM